LQHGTEFIKAKSSGKVSIQPISLYDINHMDCLIRCFDIPIFASSGDKRRVLLFIEMDAIQWEIDAVCSGFDDFITTTQNLQSHCAGHLCTLA